MVVVYSVDFGFCSLDFNPRFYQPPTMRAGH